MLKLDDIQNLSCARLLNVFIIQNSYKFVMPVHKHRGPECKGGHHDSTCRERGPETSCEWQPIGQNYACTHVGSGKKKARTKSRKR